MELDSQIINRGKGVEIMTEKRFKLIEESDWWGVTDNQLPKTEYGFREDLPNGYLSCDYEYNDLTPQEVVDLLNTLHEENQQLKKENNDYDDAINEIADILREAYEQGVSNPYLKRIGKVKLEDR